MELIDIESIDKYVIAVFLRVLSYLCVQLCIIKFELLSLAI